MKVKVNKPLTVDDGRMTAKKIATPTRKSLHESCVENSSIVSVWGNVFTLVKLVIKMTIVYA